MTAMHLFSIASLAGAMLFFAAGAATVALRRRGQAGPGPEQRALQQRAELAEAAHRQSLQQRDAASAEAARLTAFDRTRAEEIDRLRQALATAEAATRDQQMALDEQVTLVDLANANAAAAREVQTQRARADRAEAAAREVNVLRDRATRAEAAAREVNVLRDRATRAEAAAREVGTAQARADSAEAAVGLLRKTEHQLRTELERLQREAAAAQATTEQLRRELAAAQATTEQLRAVAEDRARKLAGELDRTRDDSIAAGRDLDQLQLRVRDLEAQLAERTNAVRDLSTENEHLKGRLRDAEGLRADYVRLRTTATESEFLKSEVARLERELQAVKVDALGAQRRRPARGSDRPRNPTPHSIGDSLSTVLERFADTGTRSIAIADTLGFPLASTGDDGLALAAYAALLIESANRAKQFLPIAAPTAIEIVDDHGARVSVWTFNVESDRLMLASLAVSPVETGRVESTLADLAAILAPTPAANAQ